MIVFFFLEFDFFFIIVDVHIPFLWIVICTDGVFDLMKQVSGFAVWFKPVKASFISTC